MLEKVRGNRGAEERREKRGKYEGKIGLRGPRKGQKKGNWKKKRKRNGSQERGEIEKAWKRKVWDERD